MIDESNLKKSTEQICPSCGGALIFNPEIQAMQCIYCGSSSSIEVEPIGQRNFDYLSHLNNANLDSSYSKTTHIIKCESCGGLTTLPIGEISTICSFCGSSYVVDTKELAGIKPQFIIPFQFDEKNALMKSNTWRKKLFFAPAKFKKPMADEGNHSVYIPYWSYNADTYSNYTARRGDSHSRVVTKSVNGKMQTKTETYIVWRNVSGNYFQKFSNLLILASNKNNQKIVNKIGVFNQAAMQPYSQEFVSGFAAEHYFINLEQGFNLAKANMNRQLKSNITSHIGGDRVANLHFTTDYQNISFKLFLAPIYFFGCQYKHKSYQFGVNGQTGKASGQYPISPYKVLLAFIPIIGWIILFILAKSGK